MTQQSREMWFAQYLFCELHRFYESTNFVL